MLALWRGKGGWGFIKASAPKGWWLTDSLYVYTNTYMHTGSTAVFAQSTLVCDLLCRGPPWLTVALMNALQLKKENTLLLLLCV